MHKEAVHHGHQKVWRDGARLNSAVFRAFRASAFMSGNFNCMVPQSCAPFRG